MAFSASTSLTSRGEAVTSWDADVARLRALEQQVCELTQSLQQLATRERDAALRANEQSARTDRMIDPGSIDDDAPRDALDRSLARVRVHALGPRADE